MTWPPGVTIHTVKVFPILRRPYYGAATENTYLFIPPTYRYSVASTKTQCTTCFANPILWYLLCAVANHFLFVSVFAICQILLGWKTFKYYYETDELPNPRPTQPKKNWVKSGIWATFSHIKYFFRGLGLVLHRKQTTRNLTQPNYP